MELASIISYGVTDTTRRCSFVGVGVALLVEVCYCGGVDFEVSYAQDSTQCLS